MDRVRTAGVVPGFMHFVLLNTAADKIFDRVKNVYRQNSENGTLERREREFYSTVCVCLSSRDKTEPNPDLSLHGTSFLKSLSSGGVYRRTFRFYIHSLHRASA